MLLTGVGRVARSRGHHSHLNQLSLETQLTFQHSCTSTRSERVAPARWPLLVCQAAKSRRPSEFFPCKNCGFHHTKWFGQCSNCRKPGTIDVVGVVDAPADGGGVGVASMHKLRDAANRKKQNPDAPRRSGEWVTSSGRAPVSLAEMARHGPAKRVGIIPLKGRTGHEVSRVLGEGISRGSLVLIGGDPGVGKSTILLQIAAMVAHPELDFDLLDEEEEEADAGVADESQSQGEAFAVDGSDITFSPDDGADVWLRKAAALVMQDGPEEGAEAAADGGPAEDGDGDGNGDAVISLSSSSRSAGAASTSGRTVDGTRQRGQWDSDRDEEEEEEPVRYVLYVTGEETEDQVYRRGARMQLDGCDRIRLLCATKMEEILDTIFSSQYDVVIIDSIQTIFLQDLSSSAGSVTQVRECCSSLVRMAKETGTAVFLAGHVTKAGDVGGPQTLQHMVDAVLSLEVDPTGTFRLLRASKNRFGSTSELGIFRIDATGLHGTDSSDMFVSSRSSGVPSSSITTAVMDGNRIMPCEIQALCSVMPSWTRASTPPLRSWNGPDARRMLMLINVASKHVPTLRLMNPRINLLVNVIGGVQLRDAAADLGILVAMASSYFDHPLSQALAVLGEVDLLGNLRAVRNTQERLDELFKLGYQFVIVPELASNAGSPYNVPPGHEAVRCANLRQVLHTVLGTVIDVDPHRVDKGKGRLDDEEEEGQDGEGGDAECEDVPEGQDEGW